jgi:CRISPR/Cas system CSM-associated protein Csm3 (group 7 of RAMP superfamily)
MTLKLAIEFETAMHHGSGFGLAGVVDRAALRDARGIPYLTGSAIKGKFRYAALRILRSRGEQPCGPPGQEFCKGEPWCALCRIFGSPMKPGAAVFGDAYPCEEGLLADAIAGERFAAVAPGSEVRTTTAIDRHFRTVRPAHLFSTETIASFPLFESRIGGPLAAEDLKLLHQCASILTHFGADSSRGLGLCRYELSEVAE